ncbi:GntR family transcriptional regulator [Streptomyces sp. NPDC088731]|uniref:GntR family transcriptional regulator n=1 Tax=Streptomyces sp. NPDC088731 TaxID=3365878 RepID=UPI00381BC187
MILTESPVACFEWPDDMAAYSRPLPGYLYAEEPDEIGMYRVVGMVPIPEPAEDPEDPTGLYRLRDASGGLLYVGISSNPGIRWEQHAADKPWWPEVVDKSVNWFRTRQEAEAAEVAAIKTEFPRNNATHAASPGFASKSWTAARIDRSKGAPSFARQVAALIEEEVRSGHLLPGDRLLTTPEIAAHLRTSTTVVGKAMKILRNTHIVESRPGAGIFVRSARRTRRS